MGREDGNAPVNVNPCPPRDMWGSCGGIHTNLSSNSAAGGGGFHPILRPLLPRQKSLIASFLSQFGKRYQVSVFVKYFGVFLSDMADW